MTPFEAYVSPALQRPGWWRIIAGGIMILCFWIAFTLLVLAGYGVWWIVQLGDPQAALQKMGKLVEGGSPDRILVMILTFGGIWIGVFLALAFFHGQEFGKIFAPDRRRRPAGFAHGLVLGFAFSAISIAAALTLVSPVRSELQVSAWIFWLIPLIPLIFIQATGEELIFRGYLLQQLGSRLRSPIVWAFLPSFGFGMMHYNPDLPDHGGLYYIAITTVMGLVFAALVWRSGSLWTAAGLHVGVNTVGLTVIGADGILSGTQLWLFSQEDTGRLFQVDLIVVVILLIFVLSPLGRIFGDGRRLVQEDAEIFS